MHLDPKTISELAIAFRPESFLRVIPVTHMATPLGMGFGQSRFSSPNHLFQLAYIAQDLATGIAETIIRDRFEGTAERVLDESEIAQCAVAEITAAEALIVLDLRTAGLLRLGVSTDAARAKHHLGGQEPEEFDNLLEALTQYLDAAGDHMSWMAGAMLDIVGVLLVSLLGGLAAFILVFSRLVVTLMIALAPIMIFLTLFEVTKDYFLRWLSGTVSFALYPVVVAGIFATIIGVGKAVISKLGDPSNASTIGALLPFFMMILMSKGFILATPFIVRGISGNVVMPAMIPLGSSAARFGTGLIGTQGSERRSQLGARTGSELAGAYTRQAAAAAGAQMQRMIERNRRLQK